MASNNRAILIGWLTVIFILMERCSSRPEFRHRSGDPQMYNQDAIFTLDTAGLYGLGTPSTATGVVSFNFEKEDDPARDNVMVIVKKQYDYFVCADAISDMEKGSARTINIARHRGQFNAHFGIHYGNSVTRNTRAAIISTWTTPIHCEAGNSYSDIDTNDPKEKRVVEQKCRLFKLYSDEKQRTITVSDGNALKWTHISNYLGELAKKLLPAEQNIDYTEIYNEAVCAVTKHNMDPGTTSYVISDFFEAYAYLVQRIHIHLYTLKNEVTGNSNCFEELLRFLNHLTDLQESFTDDEMGKGWDEIKDATNVKLLTTALDDNKAPTVVDYYTYDSVSSKRANVCHKEILIEYSWYINERHLEMEDLKTKVGNLQDGSIKKGITYQLHRCWQQMFQLLYKTYLMSNADRFNNAVEEDREVTKTIQALHGKITGVNFDARDWWDTKLQRLLKKIEKKNQIQLANQQA